MESIASIITELQSLGLRLGSGILARKGGAGPAEGGALTIGSFEVMAPVASPFVAGSPYELKENQGRPTLFKDNEPLIPVGIVPKPAFYDQSTADGLAYPRIALLHGRNCLATTVLQTCIHWSKETRCRFCGIELSLKSGQTIARKTPEQLAEVALAASRLDGVAHLVLTTGNANPPGSEIEHLARCARAVKEKVDLPVHAQFTPPPHGNYLLELKDAGVDTVGIHIESLDPEILAGYAPAKAALGLDRFRQSWKQAVEIFGPNQVSSFLLAGLGEKPEDLIRQAEVLADLGVFPFIVPLRPIPGSLLQERRPPDPRGMKKIYAATAQMLALKGLASRKSLAGCVRCGACSALAAYERNESKIVCHPARTRDELDQALAIRRQVFVREQNMFDGSDEDGHDAESIHLVAEMEGQIIGAVRVFPQGPENQWVGGRLAVKKDHRATGAGELLVREAVRLVARQGCTRFTAHIQEKNVPFFKKLGWKTMGPPKIYFGRPHQPMEAELNPGQENPENQDRMPAETREPSALTK